MSYPPEKAGAMVAPGEQAMSRNALDILEQHSSVAIRQDLQWLEEIFECCELKNKYKMSELPKGQENAVFTDAEFNDFPMIFDVREDSSLCCRLCCYNRREFKLGLFPPGTALNPRWPNEEPMLTLHRPFKCTWWCGTLCNPQQIWIIATDGQKIGRVEQECRCFENCCMCTHFAKSYDETGLPVHTFISPFCGTNCCAPSCCNYVFKIRVVNANNETQQLGEMKSIWPGCNWRGLCSESASNLVVHFPQNATREEKAILIGSMFLHDFLFFEKRGGDN